MKKYTLKFLVALALFFIPAIVYQYYIIPNSSGDIGNLGLIPCGKKEEGLQVSWYDRKPFPSARVVNINNPDSLRLFKYIVVGDSFSGFGSDGFQYSLSASLGHTVATFGGYGDSDVLERYLILVNNGSIGENQTVILENVERWTISRFSKIDSLESYHPITKEKVKDEENKSEGGKPNFLYSYFSWFRLMAGYKDPIARFSLNQDYFTHKRYSRSLFVYNSKQIADGDLMWSIYSDEQWKKAVDNMQRLISYSEERGINLILMIATDKYDAYEPWIKGDHLSNPTLNLLPKDSRIYDSRDCLRKAIENGTKDVYKINNTHWSVVGADIVGEDIFRFMKSSDLL